MSSDRKRVWMGFFAGVGLVTFLVWFALAVGAFHDLVRKDWKEQGYECFRVYKDSEVNLDNEIAC